MSAITATTVSRPPSLDAVLAYAWASEEFTATDVMESTGHTRSTTIDAMASLAELGLLRELPNAREAGAYRKGRPARRFELRDDAGVLVGVDAGNAHVIVAVTDLRSRTMAVHRVTLEPGRDDATTRAALIIAAVDQALDSAKRGRDEVLAICIGIPAPVNAEGRSPRDPIGFWERMNPDLIDAFGWAPLVRIDNDASLAAIAEGASGSAVGSRNYIALLAGSRLGAGVVVDGRVLRGTHGGVGEMQAFDHVDKVHSADGLGTRALEWALEAIKNGTVSPNSSLAATPLDALDARVVLELAARGDGDAREIVDRVGQVLARIVSVLGSIFDPEIVIVSGAISAGLNEVAAAARRYLPNDLDLPAPQLVISQLGADVVVTGAVASASASAQENALNVWLSRAVSGTEPLSPAQPVR